MHGVTHRIKPNKVIIVEGILILSEEELRDLFDIKYLSIPTPMCASCADCAATLKREAGAWIRSLISILPP